MTPERKAEIAIAALRQRLRGEKIPHMNSEEMKRRIENTLIHPDLQKINLTKQELEEFILEILSE